VSHSGNVVPGSVVPGLVIPGLVVPGSVVPGLVVPGLVVPGSVVPGSVGVYQLLYVNKCHYYCRNICYWTFWFISFVERILAKSISSQTFAKKTYIYARIRTQIIRIRNTGGRLNRKLPVNNNLAVYTRCHQGAEIRRYFILLQALFLFLLKATVLL
jgi:hypothetical protein